MPKFLKILLATLSVAVLVALPLSKKINMTEFLTGSQEVFAPDGPVFSASGDGYVLESLPDVAAYTVPASYEGLPVTAIGANAFAGCESLVTVKISAPVRSIGSGAFAGCNALAAVELPDSLTAIGERAFARCGALVSVNVPPRVVSIGDHAFAGCGSLTEIALPAVTEIGVGAFSLCQNLANADLGERLIKISDSAFYGCEGLAGITLPRTVEAVGKYAFSGCSSLVIYADGAPSALGSGWSGARPYYFDAGGLIRIGGGTYCPAAENATLTAFDKKLPSVAIPRVISAASGKYAVTKIGDGAFADAAAATVTLPVTLKSIGKNAFRRSAVKEITLPAALTTIGKNAFADCRALDSVYIDSPTIAAALTEAAACGGVARYATKLSVRSEITSLGGYLTSLHRLNDETHNGGVYAVYTTVEAAD